MKEFPAIQLKDPRTLYYQPDFERQKQDLPGSDHDMRPEPDHGESTYQGSGRLAGLVALITGGDSGIGRAVALAYAREGANIVFTYLEEGEDAQITEGLVKEAGRDVLSVKMDQASNAEGCRNVVVQCVETLGRLDILVNNAAFQETYESMQDIPDDEIDYAFKTNIEAFFHFSRAALSICRRADRLLIPVRSRHLNPSPPWPPMPQPRPRSPTLPCRLRPRLLSRA